MGEKVDRLVRLTGKVWVAPHPTVRAGKAFNVSGHWRDVPEFDPADPPSVTSIYADLRRARLPIGGSYRSGQIKGVSRWRTGFVGELSGTVEYRCKFCGRTSEKGHDFARHGGRKVTGAAKFWRQRLRPDGDVILRHVSGSERLKQPPAVYAATRKSEMERAVKALTEAGYEVTAEGEDTLRVRRASPPDGYYEAEVGEPAEVYHEPDEDAARGDR